MKKMKLFLSAGVIALFATSCTLTHTAIVTNNPVGSKVGVAKGNPFSKDFDISYAKAKANGGISKIGIAEFKVKQFIIPFYKTTVTGE